MPTPNNINKMTMSLINWLLNSGIQNNCKDGGFNSWYEIEKRSYPFIYPEITGYGITSFLYLIKIMKVNRIEIQKRAEIAAKWLLSHAIHKSGGIKVRFGNNNKTNRSKYLSCDLLYSFDSGVVLCGLTNLYKQTKKQIYLDIFKKDCKISNHLTEE